jgi:mannose-1-phosphate guanylyltransferase
MEHARQVAVVPAEIGWIDVGSWASLYELLPADARGNRWTGPHLEIDASGVLAYNRERLVAVIGMQDLIIVDTPDALLVCPRSREQEVKQLVEMLKTSGQTSWL